MPTKDLSFFLLQNCQDSLVEAEFERTITYYHDQLTEALTAMGVPIEDYTLQVIKDEYKSIAYLSMLHIITMAPTSFTADNGTDDAKRRFYNKFVHMFNNGLLNCTVFN